MNFVYDGAGHLVSAEPGSRRKLIATDRMRSLRATTPTDFASLERAYAQASNAKDEIKYVAEAPSEQYVCMPRGTHVF